MHNWEMHTLDGRDTIEVHLEYKGVEYNKDRLGRVDDMKTSGTWYIWDVARVHDVT
jgi:hypothetical protein